MPRTSSLDETHLVSYPRGGDIRVGLVYPNRYYVGMSSLGYQVIYHAWNREEDTRCERVFLPSEGEKPVSLESGWHLAQFDIVAFSIAFELDYPHIPQILAQGRLPVFASQRERHHPLVLAGGIAVTYNPEPIAPFFDGIVLGEAEGVLPQLLESYRAWRKARLASRQDLWHRLAQIPGLYVPSLYECHYTPEGTIQQVTPRSGAPLPVRAAFTPDIDALDTHSVILTPHTEFANVHLIEIARGCGRQCRFCIAAYAHRWPRYRSLESTLACAQKASAHTDRIGLVGSSVSDHPEIDAIAQKLVEHGFRISVASLRAETVRPPLLDALATSGQNTVTLAPEVATQRLQGVINKPMPYERLFEVFEEAQRRGIRNLRLYFLIGVPGEREEDIEAIVAMGRRMRSILAHYDRLQRRRGRIKIVISPLVPKPHTPFQWIAMAPVKQVAARLRTLQKQLGPLGGLEMTAASARLAQMEGVLSRGDRRLAEVLTLMGVHGLSWNQAMRRAKLDADFYAHRERPMEEILPWGHLDLRVERPYLQLEFRRHLRGTTSSDCKVGICHKCGACP